MRNELRDPRRLAALLLLLLVGGAPGSSVAAPPAPEEPQTTAPPVERVVVFADRAEVTRRGPARCTDGAATLVFGGLPTRIDVRTLRGEASGAAKVIGTAHRTVTLGAQRDPQLTELKRALEQTQVALRTLELRETALAERMRELAGYGQYWGAVAGEEARGDKPDPQRWTPVLDTLRTDRVAVTRQQTELIAERRKLLRQAELLQRRLDRLAPEQRREALEVTVAVQCGGEAQPRVGLSYVVPGATWHPEYDLRFFPDGGAKIGAGRVELTVAAVVQQSSGEDWRQVQLVLSTAKPRLGAEAPYPAALTVYGGPAGKKKVLVDALERRERLEGPAQSTGGGPASAQLEDRGQSFALVLPHKVTLQADGRPYWLPVDVTNGSGQAKLVTIPKLRSYVFQVATLKNPAPYPLLAGRLHAYRGASYVGDVELEYRAPGEPMEVSLGIDEELRVERKEVKEQDRSAGVFSSTKHLERVYRIRLTNNARTKLPVEVRENIPVTKVEDVKVELLGRTTKGYELDAHRGILRWTVATEPAKEQVLDLGYVIHLPEDWDVKIR